MDNLVVNGKIVNFGNTFTLILSCEHLQKIYAIQFGKLIVEKVDINECFSKLICREFFFAIHDKKEQILNEVYPSEKVNALIKSLIVNFPLNVFSPVSDDPEYKMEIFQISQCLSLLRYAVDVEEEDYEMDDIISLKKAYTEACQAYGEKEKELYDQMHEAYKEVNKAREKLEKALKPRQE